MTLEADKKKEAELEKIFFLLQITSLLLYFLKAIFCLHEIILRFRVISRDSK